MADQDIQTEERHRWYFESRHKSESGTENWDLVDQRIVHQEGIEGFASTCREEYPNYDFRLVHEIVREEITYL